MTDIYTAINPRAAAYDPAILCTICGQRQTITVDGKCTACWTPPPPPPTERKRPEWDTYFFDMCRLVSRRATCPRAAIGVVIVDDHHRVVSTGYNGALHGEPHCTAEGCTIFADHCVRARHAEVSALDAAWEQHITLLEYQPDGDPHERDNFLKKLNPVAYVVGPRPICSHCARSLYQAGVRDVKWKEA